MSDEAEKKSKSDNQEAIDLNILKDLSFGPSWSSGTNTGTTTTVKRAQPSEGRKHKSPGGSSKRDRRPRPANADNKGVPFRKPRAFFKPTIHVDFYPEDKPFQVLAKAIRSSCKTYELFEIANLILSKNDRFVVVIKSKVEKDGKPESLFISLLDSMPFETEEQALAYIFNNYMDRFFNMETIEVEPPKGSFPVVNRCGITGELLGPPNYHRYQQLLQQHYSAHLSHLPFEKFQAKIEVVKDDEQVKAWIEKMTKQTRYTLKEKAEGETENTVFDTWEEARLYLLNNKKKKLVRPVESARFSGVLLDIMPEGNIKSSIEDFLLKQREFPLETANNSRGRLRRMKFNLYKKGPKGISYVCAVKRKFREEGKTAFSESIQKLIEFIEKHQKISVLELPEKYLGVPAIKKSENAEQPEEASSGKNHLTPEQQSQVRQLMLDLRWLVSEGYVTEYGDGSLFASPALVKKPKKLVEESEKSTNDTFSQSSESDKEAVLTTAETKASTEDSESEKEV